MRRRLASGLALLVSVPVVLSARGGLAWASAPFGEAPTAHSRLGAVASATPEATAAGAAVLAAGGNAVDAAVTTAFALAVTYPPAGNLAGGGFAVGRTPGGELWALDFRETAPAGTWRNSFLGPDGRARRGASTRGGLAVATPGTVRGLEALHRRYGKLPWARLIAPAARLARDGFRVPPGLAKIFSAYAGDLARDPAASMLFAPGGVPLAAGALLVQEDLARTLETIAREARGGRDEAAAVRLRRRALPPRHDAAAVVRGLPPRLDPRAAPVRSRRDRRPGRAGDAPPRRRGRAPGVRGPQPLPRRSGLRRRPARGAPRPRAARGARFFDRPRARDALIVDSGRGLAARARPDDALRDGDGRRRRRLRHVHAQRHAREPHGRAGRRRPPEQRDGRLRRGARRRERLWPRPGRVERRSRGSPAALVHDAAHRPRGRPPTPRPRLAGGWRHPDDGSAGLPERGAPRRAAWRSGRRAKVPPPAPAGPHRARGRRVSRGREGDPPREGPCPRRARHALHGWNARARPRDRVREGRLAHGGRRPARLRRSGRTVGDGAPFRGRGRDGIVRPPRGVAQPGSAHGSGPWGRRFESSRPDHSSPLGPASRAGPFSFPGAAA